MRRPRSERIGMFWRFGSDERQPAGRGDGLVEGRVEPAVALGDEQRQSLDVGRPELRVEPPVEQLADHRMRRLELFEDRGVGRVAGLGPLALGQVQLVEEDLLELLGRAEIEVVADVEVDLRLQARHLARRTRRRAGPAPRGRWRRRRPPSRPGPGSAASRSRGRGGRDPASARAFSSGSRTASAASASRPTRTAAGTSPAGGSVTSSRSWATSAIVWLRSEALSRYAAICVSKATGSGVAAPPAMFATTSGLVSWPTTRAPDCEQQIAEPADGLVALGDQHAAVAAGQGERLRHAPHRPRVVHQQRGADLRPAGQPRRRLGRVRVRGVEAVHAASGPRPRPEAPRPGRPGRPPPPSAPRRAGASADARRPGRRGLGQPRRPEVHRELQPLALADERAACAASRESRRDRRASRPAGPAAPRRRRAPPARSRPRIAAPRRRRPPTRR